QKALDLNMDGLMVETHTNPQNALSDAVQQVNPHTLFEIVDGLVHRQDSVDDKEFTNKLVALRADIDKLDDQIIGLLAQRMEIIKNIGFYKKENQVTIFQLERWKQILDRTTKGGTGLGLSNSFVKGIYHVIHDES